MSSDKAPLMLSVSGMRGIVGKSLTPVNAARFGAAYGEWLKASRPNVANPEVVVGRDSRPSGEMVECAVAAGLVSVGCKVTLLGIVSTPAVGVMIGEKGADGGMVITASHNPIIWNGIKSLRYDGVAPPADEAGEIIRRYNEDDVVNVEVESLQAIERNGDAVRVHVDKVLGLVDVEKIQACQFKVVLDSVCGAGGEEGVALLEALGVEVVHMYGEPTGIFPHTPEPTAANLVELCERMKEVGADAGFAQDPDADRLAVVDEHGTYIGEEYTLALSVKHMLEHREKGDVAANLSTSRMIDDLAAAAGVRVIRTKVGEANVAEGMRDNGCVLGGEGNGGIMWPAISQVRDSLAGMALILELMAFKKKSLSGLVAEIPSYAIVKDKTPIAEGLADKAFEQLREKYAELKIDSQDGLRIDWEDQWVHLRASNTEPILRVIAESTTLERAQGLVDTVNEMLHKPAGV